MGSTGDMRLTPITRCAGTISSEPTTIMLARLPRRSNKPPAKGANTIDAVMMMDVDRFKLALDRLTAGERRRLVCALAMVAGWEALIVQRDVCGLSVAEGEALSVWAARALVDVARRDARKRR